MRFARAFGGEGDAPGQLNHPWGVAVVRGLLVVAEYTGERLQVLTPKGVPLQVLTLADSLAGIYAGEERVCRDRDALNVARRSVQGLG
jgi:hypothetical protein